MAWANQKVYEAVMKLPDEALGSYIVNPEWTANKILRHICGGATWYVFRLEIEDWRDIPKINTMAAGMTNAKRAAARCWFSN